MPPCLVLEELGRDGERCKGTGNIGSSFLALAVEGWWPGDAPALKLVNGLAIEGLGGVAGTALGGVASDFGERHGSELDGLLVLDLSVLDLSQHVSFTGLQWGLGGEVGFDVRECFGETLTHNGLCGL